jgi:hypothetical protein
MRVVLPEAMERKMSLQAVITKIEEVISNKGSRNYEELCDHVLRGFKDTVSDKPSAGGTSQRPK